MLDLVEFYNCVVMVDNMNDEVNKVYVGMLIWFYIIKN